jgi:hypothetical protein
MLGQFQMGHEIAVPEQRGSTPAPSGDAALHRKGVKKSSRRVHKAIAILRSLIHYDVLHIGGGNAPRLIDPPRDVRIGANTAGLTGGTGFGRSRLAPRRSSASWVLQAKRLG